MGLPEAIMRKRISIANLSGEPFDKPPALSTKNDEAQILENLFVLCKDHLTKRVFTNS